MVQYLLLTGAGFSRNWGCWLASEVWNAIYGQPIIQKDKELRVLLWTHKKDGFEIALDKARNSLPVEKITILETAIIEVFKRMDLGILDISSGRRSYSDITQIENELCQLIAKFHTFFTLNQDLLIERRLLKNLAISLSSSRRSGLIKPGIREVRQKDFNEERVDLSSFLVPDNFMPYIKLHGAFNLRDDTDNAHLVMGGGKEKQINNIPLLKRYSEFFKEKLAVENTRLLIIGYSFADMNINKIISDAIESGSLRIYILNPTPLDNIESNLIAASDPLASNLPYGLIGSSQRNFLDIFRHTNEVELERIRSEFFIT